MKKLLFIFIAMLLIGASEPPNLQEIQTAFTARYGPGVTVIIESVGLIPRIEACNDHGCSWFWVFYHSRNSGTFPPVIEFSVDTRDHMNEGQFEAKGTNKSEFDTVQEE